MADDIYTRQNVPSHGVFTWSNPAVEDSSTRGFCDFRSLDSIPITPPAKALLVGRIEDSPLVPQDSEKGHFCKHSCTSTALTLVCEENKTDDLEALGDRTSKRLVVNRYTTPCCESVSLTAKKGFKLYRLLRWRCGSVYRRILCLAVLANILALAFAWLRHSRTGSGPLMTTASTAASANILAAILVRNEHVVNALFIAFGTWPARLPLPVRRILARVYCYGGIHSGCSIAATLWYVVLLVITTRDFSRTGLSVLRGYVYFVSYAAIALLSLIIAFAVPGVRVRAHNWFEGVHRFAGWAAVLLFWAQTLLLSIDVASSRGVPFALMLVVTPSFWILVAVTLLIVYPWTRLRRRDVEAEVLSDHCVRLNLTYTNVHYGQAVRLSDAPLKETHAFAVIPVSVVSASLQCEPMPRTKGTSIFAPVHASEKLTTVASTSAAPLPFPTNQKGFSVLVSSAGDWTNKVIRNPPSKIYTRGVPHYGVLRIAGLFAPVLVVATGSGIGPCLSLFVERPDHPIRVVWSAQCPAETYGLGVVDVVRRADPHAVIVDTKEMGRVDLVGLAYGVWDGSRPEGGMDDVLGKRGGRRGRCEAVVVISNQTVTRKVVYGLESRGVPAYRAIFDS